MSDAAAVGLGLAAFTRILLAFLVLYTVVALGRIWMYSKQQAQLLGEIRDRLPTKDGAAAPE